MGEKFSPNHPMKSKHLHLLPALCIGASLAWASPASATIVDLINNEVATVDTIYGTAIFQTASPKPAGSGFVDNMNDVFLTLRAHGSEQGYNTDASPAPYDVQRDGTRFNNSLQLSDLETVTAGGTEYFQFVIDINEPNGGKKSLISLDQLKLFTSTDPSQTTLDIESLGIKRFDLDLPADSFLKYDDQNSGSGEGDIAFFIPTAAFYDPASLGLNLPVAKSSDYLYLYAQFGANISADYETGGGYEEFWTGRGMTPVPEPSAVVPLAGILVLAGMQFHRRRRVAAVR